MYWFLNVHTLCVHTQMMELSLPAGSSRKVSLEQRLAETEGYYYLLREQVQVWWEREGGGGRGWCAACGRIEAGRGWKVGVVRGERYACKMGEERKRKVGKL